MPPPPYRSSRAGPRPPCPPTPPGRSVPRASGPPPVPAHLRQYRPHLFDRPRRGLDLGQALPFRRPRRLHSIAFAGLQTIDHHDQPQEPRTCDYWHISRSIHLHVCILAGTSRSASRPRRTSAAWISTRSAAIRLVPAHHPGHARPRFPRRDGRSRGTKGAAETVRRPWYRAHCGGNPATPGSWPFPTRATRWRRCAHALNWSHWRQRRQAVARRCHYHRRWHSFEGRSQEDRP